MWILCHWNNFHQFSLLTWNSFLGQLFQPIGGEGSGKVIGRGE